MLNFRNTNIFFIILLAIAIGLDWYAGIPFFVYPLLLLLYSGIVFWGCYFVHSNFFLPVICSAVTAKKEIAISFDDGPCNQYTPEILQVLQEHGVKTAFFCIGSRIGENKQLFQRLHSEGHLIGNHSYSHHFWFDLFSSKKMLEDLAKMDREMKSVTGLQPKLFRPPYGVTNPNLKKAIRKGAYTPIGWSVRSMDTVIKDEKTLFDRISKTLKPGAIFLFHDTNKTTIKVLPAFIQWVKESGYEIVRLDKMLHLEPYA
ncbi:MAG: polysaccharide deacetylase family protein [Ferruginibacter sp.]|nr:polysaccharide deacetylase family protein [Ferruginibacter sp.]